MKYKISVLTQDLVDRYDPKVGSNTVCPEANDVKALAPGNGQGLGNGEVLGSGRIV